MGAAGFGGGGGKYKDVYRKEGEVGVGGRHTDFLFSESEFAVVGEISGLGFLLHPGLGNYVPSFAPLSILAPIVAPERFPLRRPVIRESPPQPTKPESRTLDWEGGKGFGRGTGRGKGVP